MSEVPTLIIRAKNGVVAEVIGSEAIAVHWIDDKGTVVEVLDISTADEAGQDITEL